MPRKRTVSKKAQPDTNIVVVQIALVFFFLILGIQGIVNIQDADPLTKEAIQLSEALGIENQMQKELDFITVLNISVLVPALFYSLSLFKIGSKKVHYFVAILSILIWAIRIIAIHFVYEINVTDGAIVFTPGLLNWFSLIAADLLVLAVLWVVSRRFS